MGISKWFLSEVFSTCLAAARCDSVARNPLKDVDVFLNYVLMKMLMKITVLMKISSYFLFKSP